MTTMLVTDTVRDAAAKEKVTDGPTLHSDQGSQYTSKEYVDLTQLYHIQPSMSSSGCPYDNAAMAEYMQFYNFERINMENGLTPDEIRSKAA